MGTILHRLLSRLGVSDRLRFRYYRLRMKLGYGPKDDRELYFRLCYAVGAKPRNVAGEFTFPFGTVSYVDGLSLQFQYHEIFQERGYEFRPDNENPVILDCGGNVGMSVAWFKLTYPGARIKVFEADPGIARVLAANIDALNLKGVSLVSAAVWTRTGRIAFATDNADGGCITSDANGSEVDCVRLSDHVCEPIDLLKLDIEGAEYDVLLDLCATGKISLVKRIACEVHGRRPGSSLLGEVLTGLHKAGFHVTFNHARSAPDMPGAAEESPFFAAADGRFLLHMYAWRN